MPSGGQGRPAGAEHYSGVECIYYGEPSTAYCTDGSHVGGFEHSTSSEQAGLFID
jgi:hypothetical protein